MQNHKVFLVISTFMAVLAHCGAFYCLYNWTWEPTKAAVKENKSLRDKQLELTFNNLPQKQKDLPNDEQLLAFAEEGGNPGILFSKDDGASTSPALHNPSISADNIAADNPAAPDAHADLAAAPHTSVTPETGTATPQAPGHGPHTTMGIGMNAPFTRDNLLDAMRSRQRSVPEHPSSNSADSDAFTTHLEYTPKQDGSGYIFQLKLIPKEDAGLQRIVQNVFFLLDRSQQQNHEQDEKTGWAILQALMLLQEGDTFNVMTFGDVISRLSSDNLAWNEQNLLKAYDFLMQSQKTGAPAANELLDTLHTIVSDAQAHKGVNTAILLTEGGLFANIDRSRAMMSEWSQRNGSKLSLYSVATESENHLAILDLLSAVNKGATQYAANETDLPSTLHALMESLQSPIGQDMTATASADPEAKLMLFPVPQRLPNLYAHAPYVLYGSTDKLEDFSVIFQGSHNDKPLNIKKQISFRNLAPSTDGSLELMWMLQQAYDSYFRYLQTGNQEHLLQAQQLLTEYKLPIPY